MAKNTKETFAELLKRLKKSKAPETRDSDFLEELKYYLIVCEGEKTEPSYFAGFNKYLPSKIQTIKVIGEGKNTVDVVRSAIEIRDKRKFQNCSPDFDEVWAIFDRDSFPINRIKDAFSLAETNSIEIGFSNEAFELWYILHFHYLDAKLDRKQYIEYLNKILTKNGKTPYTKNSAEMYDLLLEIGNQSNAIKFAAKLDKIHFDKKPHEKKPSSTIYKLVQSLNKYLKVDTSA